MNDADLYKEVLQTFGKHLEAKKEKLVLRIKDTSKDEILGEQDMNYGKVLFDSDLNIYKRDKDGNVTKVENTNFEVVVLAGS